MVDTKNAAARDDSQVVFCIPDDNTDPVVRLWRQWLNARLSGNDEALAHLDREIRAATPETFEGALCQIRIIQAREANGPVNSSDDLAKALGNLSRLGGASPVSALQSDVSPAAVEALERYLDLRMGPGPEFNKMSDQLQDAIAAIPAAEFGSDPVLIAIHADAAVSDRHDDEAVDKTFNAICDAVPSTPYGARAKLLWLAGLEAEMDQEDVEQIARFLAPHTCHSAECLGTEADTDADLLRLHYEILNFQKGYPRGLSDEELEARTETLTGMEDRLRAMPAHTPQGLLAKLGTGWDNDFASLDEENLQSTKAVLAVRGDLLRWAEQGLSGALARRKELFEAKGGKISPTLGGDQKVGFAKDAAIFAAIKAFKQAAAVFDAADDGKDPAGFTVAKAAYDKAWGALDRMVASTISGILAKAWTLHESTQGDYWDARRVSKLLDEIGLTQLPEIQPLLVAGDSVVSESSPSGIMTRDELKQAIFLMEDTGAQLSCSADILERLMDSCKDESLVWIASKVATGACPSSD